MHQSVIADVYRLPDEIALVGHKEPCLLESRNRPAERSAYIVEVEVWRRIFASELSGNKISDALLVLDLQSCEC